MIPKVGFTHSSSIPAVVFLTGGSMSRATTAVTGDEKKQITYSISPIHGILTTAVLLHVYIAKCPLLVLESDRMCYFSN